MKKHNHRRGLLLVCALLGSLSGGTAAYAAPEMSLSTCDAYAFAQTRDGVIAPLLEALQAGDIEQIRQYLSGPMAARYQTLFDENAEYGGYLRNYYNDSTFELVDIVVNGDGHTAHVQVQWPDSRTADMQLRLGGEQADLEAIPATNCQ